MILRRCLPELLCLWLFIGILSPAAAQELAPEAIVLPTRLVAGQAATLAVLDAEGRLAPGVAVEFSGGGQVITDDTGRAGFTAPGEPGVLLARSGGAAASATVIREPADAGLRFARVPRVVALADRFAVTGFGFSGQADGNQVTLGGQPTVVLAASPVALVVLPSPRAERGATELTVSVDGRRAGPAAVTVVTLELAAGKARLGRRERSRLAVRVRGSEQRLELEARNLTPAVVRLRGGDTQRLVSSGGADNTATVELQGRGGGEFAVSVRLIPEAAGAPDVETVRQTLVAARRIAPRKWLVRTDRLVQTLANDPAAARAVQLELERLLAEYPEGEFGRLLEQAWRMLLGL